MNRKNLLTAWALAFVLFVAGCSEPKPAEEVEVIDPWLRAMPETVNSTAGFMTIKNNSGQPLVLTGVSLDWAKHAMLHESKVVDGMAKMQHLDELVIEQELRFQPGAKHIMVMGLKQPLVEGQSYNIRLHFKNRPPLEVAFEVRQAN